MLIYIYSVTKSVGMLASPCLLKLTPLELIEQPQGQGGMYYCVGIISGWPYASTEQAWEKLLTRLVHEVCGTPIESPSETKMPVPQQEEEDEEFDEFDDADIPFCTRCSCFIDDRATRRTFNLTVRIDDGYAWIDALLDADAAYSLLGRDVTADVFNALGCKEQQTILERFLGIPVLVSLVVVPGDKQQYKVIK